MNIQVPCDLWFANVDDLPWFIEEMGLSSCYDAHHHKEEIEAKYGIYRRSPLGNEYGHHFVFTDKEKYKKELTRYEAEKASNSSKKPVESSTMNNNTNSLVEELLLARHRVTQLENAISDSNKERLDAFKAEFDALREKYRDIELKAIYCGPTAVARIKNSTGTGLGFEEVELF